MNLSVNTSGQSPRVADYFAVVGTTDELVPITQTERETISLSTGKTLDIKFEPSILDQYPLVQRKDCPFPSGVPLFCFPNSLEIFTDSKSPSFFSFVQTSESGAHILGCCLIIYEPITSAAKKSLMKIVESKADPALTAKVENTRLLVPKCLCIIGTWPFIDSFKKILCQLYRISLSPSILPIERYICNLLDDVPAPPPGRVAINYYMGDLAVSFRCPPSNMPHVWNSFPMDPLFECLDLNNVLTLFSAVLAERQIVLVSTQLSLLTTCAEVITSLMYPLRWSHVYIPILPKALLGVLGAPVPFIVGLHANFLKSPECQIPEEAFTMYIDENRAELGSLGKPPSLPESRGRKLFTQLQPLVSPTFDNRLSPWKSARLVHFDSAFNMSVRPDRANGTLEQGKPSMDEKTIRELFLRFFVAIIKNYRKYLIYPSHDNPNPLVNFRHKDFIEDHPSDWGDFLGSLTRTQAFCQFCDARISSSSLKDADIRFFDESIEAKLNRYTFRFFNVDTPFLNDQSSKHFKTVVAAAPSLDGLPGNPTSIDALDDHHTRITGANTSPTRGSTGIAMASPGDSTDSHSSNGSSSAKQRAFEISNILGRNQQRKSQRSISTGENSVELSEAVNNRLTDPDVASDVELGLTMEPKEHREAKKKSEPIVYVYETFPRLKPELYSLPREGLDGQSVRSIYSRHSKKELRELQANPFTAAPLKSNDVVAELFSSSLKRIPQYKHRLQGLSEGLSGLFFSSGGSSPHGSTNNHSKISGHQRNFARRGSGGVSSTFSETPSEANANACIHNAFLTLLCFVISKNKYLPAVRRAPPSTTKLIDEYGKGLSDAIRGSLFTAPQGLDEDFGGGNLKRSGSHSSLNAVSNTKTSRPSVVKRASSSGPSFTELPTGDSAASVFDSDQSVDDAIATRNTLSSIGSLPSAGRATIARPSGVQFTVLEAKNLSTDYDSDQDFESSRGFKNINDNIREETLVASKAGLKMAFEVLYLMTDKGLPPDELTYRSLGECCAVCGDGHCAIDLLEDMLYWGWYPDPDITSSVVQAMLHSSARDPSSVGKSVDSGDAFERFSYTVGVGGSHGSLSAGGRANFVSAKDVLDAVYANRLDLLRDRLEPRVDDDIHTYAINHVPRGRGSQKGTVSRAPVMSSPVLQSSKLASSLPNNVSKGSSPSTTTTGLSIASPVLATSVESNMKSPSPRSHQATEGSPLSDIFGKGATFEKPSSPSSGFKTNPKTSGDSSSYLNRKSRILLLDTPVTPASPRLKTQILLADRILDMQFPELDINLQDPFGTFCPSPSCGKSHTMSQLREGWDGVDPNKYTTKCFYCFREFVPRFTVHSSAPTWMREDSDYISDPIPEELGKGSDELLWCELLSPWVLRKELLMILLNDGIDRLLSVEFRKPSPSNTQNSVIFWNMIVAFRMCGLPYSFLISDTLSTAFLVPLGEVPP